MGDKFVFMPNYSNPTKDSKRLENRQKVAKYAMLGRQKNPPKSSSQSQTQSPPASPPIFESADNHSGGSHAPSAVSLATEHSQGIPSHHPFTSLASDGSARHSSSENRFGTSSNESISLSPPTHELRITPSQSSASALSSSSLSPPQDTFSLSLDHYSTRHTDAELSTEFENDALPTLQPSNAQQSTSRPGGPFGSLSSGHTDFYPPVPVANEFGGTRLRKEQPMSLFDPHDTNHNSQRNHMLTSTTRRATKITPSSRDALSESRALMRQSGSGRGAGLPQAGPRAILSAACRDPFSSLPINSNAHTDELLYQYMNARLISSVYAQGSPDTFERIKKMRHTVWGPLILKSKASLNALVAYVESTPGLPIRSKSQGFLEVHIQAAVSSVREALSQPNAATDDSICFAVMLLMLTAMRTGNMATFTKHAAGLATLLSYRTEALRANGGQDEIIEKLRAFYVTDPNDKCLYCQVREEQAGSPPKLPTDVQSFNDATVPRGEGFRDLMRRGILSPVFKSFIDPAMVWSTLSERARRDKLSAAIGATHAWIDEGEFSLKGPIHFLDTACHTAGRLCFYLSSWLDWQHSCSAVRRLAKAVYLSFQRTDNDTLLQQCPDLVLWLALMAGPLSEGDARAYFADLLVKSRVILGLSAWDFQTTVDLYSVIYVWSNTMTPGAETFWVQYGFPYDEYGNEHVEQIAPASAAWNSAAFYVSAQ